MIVNEEDNDKTQETITTVSTPSITTYQKGSTVINNDEYLASTGDIFVTVNDGTTGSTPDLANGALQDLTGKAAIYTIPSGKTEADVVDALSIRDDHPASDVTIKGRNGMELREQTLTLTNTIEYGVDGNKIEIPVDGTKKKAARFTPTAPVAPSTLVTYAFVYTKSPIYYTTDRYEAVTKAAGADVTNLYRNFNLTSVTGDAQYGYTYMNYNTSTGVLTQENKFVGQLLTSVYTRTGAGTTESPYGFTAATGFAATGTTY